MKNLSKSYYNVYYECPMRLWLLAHKPEEAEYKKALLGRTAYYEGIHELPKQLLGPYKDATVLKQDGTFDEPEMIRLTRQYMNEGVENIYRASFGFDGIFCTVNILHKTSEGWAIYEEAPVLNEKVSRRYAQIRAFLKWGLSRCGVNVTDTHIITVNRNYVLEGDLDIHGLFCMIDDDDVVDAEMSAVPFVTELALDVINKEEEPDIELSERCLAHLTCPFLNYCKRRYHVPSPSVLDLYSFGKFNTKRKLELYHEGLLSFEDLRNISMGEIQDMQVDAYLNQVEIIAPYALQRFLNKLTYPLYFLSMWSIEHAIPQYQGTKAFEHIPFMYSYHKKATATADYEHRAYLPQSDAADPRRALAEQICADIPLDVCILTYDYLTVQECLRKLAKLYPDLALHLMNISAHLVPLSRPFQAGFYYVPAMNGSFGFSSVFGALFPAEPLLDNNKLDVQVQDGTDAKRIFTELKNMEPTEATAARQALLSHCEQCTWGFVKIYERLQEKAETLERE